MGSHSSSSNSPSSFKPVLHTRRLTLTVFDENRPDHCDHVIACFQDPVSVGVQGDFGIHTHEQLKALAHHMLLSPSFCGGKVSPRMAAYNIHLGSSSLDPMIGVLSLAQRSQTVPPDIGWVVLHQHTGHGYASEAGKEFFRYMTEEYGITEMVALVKPTNAVSIKVAKKIGFVEGGEVIGEDDIPRRVFILKGMKKIDPGTRINFHGEEGEKPKDVSTGL